jgi:hypothetical protein
MNMLSKASALGFVAPFLLNGGPALADEGCKQAPAPLDSNRPALIDLSRRTPVLIAQASPANCPPLDGADVVLNSRRQLRDLLLKGLDKSRKLLDQVPGG